MIYNVTGFFPGSRATLLLPAQLVLLRSRYSLEWLTSYALAGSLLGNAHKIIRAHS